MKAAIESELERRGQPFAKTAWGPDEIRFYTKWQLAMHAAGKLRESELGGYAWKLPSKTSENGPAPLPAEVVQFIETGELPEKSSKKGKPTRDRDEDSHRYSVQLRKGKAVLLDNETGQKIYLPDIPKSNYIIYEDDAGTEIVWSQIEGKDAMYCKAAMDEAEKKEKPPAKAVVTAGAATLKGQKPGLVRWLGVLAIGGLLVSSVTRPLPKSTARVPIVIRCCEGWQFGFVWVWGVALRRTCAEVIFSSLTVSVLTSVVDVLFQLFCFCLLFKSTILFSWLSSCFPPAPTAAACQTSAAAAAAAAVILADAVLLLLRFGCSSSFATLTAGVEEALDCVAHGAFCSCCCDRTFEASPSAAQEEDAAIAARKCPVSEVFLHVVAMRHPEHPRCGYEEGQEKSRVGCG